MKAQSPTERDVVLQVVPSLEAGGAERTAVDMAAALAARGIGAPVASEGGRLVAELASVGGTWIDFPAASKNPASIVVNGFRLARLSAAQGVTLLHARSRAPAWSALIAARRVGLPFVTTYHGAYNQTNALKGAYNGVMARGDLVIANSAYTERLILERHPFAAGRTRVIHRGTDLERFDRARVSPDRITALRQAWGLAGERVVLLAARLTAWKGQRVLIEAASLLRERGAAGLVFILAGDAQGRADYVEELRLRIARHGLEGCVRLVGHCADMPAALCLADVLAVPSVEPEAFGRSAVEAQAMGVPVVVSDLGAVPETVLDAAEGRTGWRVTAGDASALALALEEALSLDPAERSRMADRARRHVAARFSLEAMTGATLDVYEDLLGRPLRGASTPRQA